MRYAILIAIMLLTFSPPSAASDGAIEINQLCAAAGCFEGDDPGFPIQITVDGSYILTSNLEIAESAIKAITISAGGELDLNGFIVKGPVTCVGPVEDPCQPNGAVEGINTGGSPVSVHSGTIQGFGAGIVTNGGRLWDLTIFGNGGPGIFAGSVTVRDSTVSSNEGIGIDAGVTATVNNVSLTANGGDAIRVFRGTVLNSTLTGNGGYGISSVPEFGPAGSVAYGFNVLDDNEDGAIQGASVLLGCNSINGSADCPP